MATTTTMILAAFVILLPVIGTPPQPPAFHTLWFTHGAFRTAAL
ncbi:hypothetical protein [Klebsiella pneumoniae]|nr:hypothetical protein [Klebsiella pneumoniae]